jgi:exopolyphosphatase / guanosine-5'-triphosphate,3'-diphosphate pyrophosphatase
MRKCVIDIGTNTFNLLIAEHSPKELKIIHSSKRGVALGMGGITKGVLTEDAMFRAIEALIEFEIKIKEFEVSDVRLIATAAVREANNSEAFVELVKKEVGRDVFIIDGKQEAKFIFQGVSMCHKFQSESMIMDIGGGSTEFIRVNQNGIGELISLKIGVSRLYQTFSCSDPFTKSDVEKIESYIENESKGFFLNKTVECLIGSSGTFETFYELIHKKKYPFSSETMELEVQPFMESLNDLIFSTQDERNKNEFIIPIRKKMAPFAAVKTRWVLQQLNVKKVLISPFSLKEGALSE